MCAGHKKGLIVLHKPSRLVPREKSSSSSKGRVTSVPGLVVDELIKEMELFATVGESRLLLGVCPEGATVNRVGTISGGIC